MYLAGVIFISSFKQQATRTTTMESFHKRPTCIVLSYDALYVWACGNLGHSSKAIVGSFPSFYNLVFESHDLFSTITFAGRGNNAPHN